MINIILTDVKDERDSEILPTTIFNRNYFKKNKFFIGESILEIYLQLWKTEKKIRILSNNPTTSILQTPFIF